MLIYKITNMQNGKIYIGQTTKSLQFRWKKHVDNAKYRHSKSILHDAILKYGPDSFRLEVIEYLESIDQLNEREIHWIALYDSTNSEIGYNIYKGGSLTQPKAKASKDQKEKNSIAMKKRIENGFTGHLGFKHTDETKARISEKKRGRNDYSKEALEIKSEKMTGSRNMAYKHVDDIELLDILICTPNIRQKDLAIHFGVSKQTMISKIRGIFGCNLSIVKELYTNNIVEFYKQKKEEIVK